jgi:hypothetical protein
MIFPGHFPSSGVEIIFTMFSDQSYFLLQLENKEGKGIMLDQSLS